MQTLKFHDGRLVPRSNFGILTIGYFIPSSFTMNHRIWTSNFLGWWAWRRPGMVSTCFNNIHPILNISFHRKSLWTKHRNIKISTEKSLILSIQLQQFLWMEYHYKTPMKSDVLDLDEDKLFRVYPCFSWRKRQKHSYFLSNKWKCTG